MGLDANDQAADPPANQPISPLSLKIFPGGHASRRIAHVVLHWQYVAPVPVASAARVVGLGRTRAASLPSPVPARAM